MDLVDDPKLFDSVRLTETHGGHPAGTLGAIVDVHTGSVEVELIDEKTSYTLELLEIPLTKLRRLDEPRASAA